MDKAIIYARLSREDEDKIDGDKKESRSIENQIKLLENYAKENRIYVYKVLYDDGVSGGVFDRPGLNQVIKEMENHSFQILLLKDFSRLGRKMHRVGDLIENIFPAYNIRVISVDDKYDSAVNNLDDMIVLKNFVNDYNLRDFKKKMRKVRTHNAMTKHLNYYPKFGYVYDDKGNEMVDERAANIIKRVYDLIGNQGLPTTVVANLFNTEGVPTRSYYATEVLGLKALHKNPSKLWNAEMVWEIARDYEYCGHSLNWVRHDKKERILLKNTHLAIVDESLYWKTQKVIDGHSKLKNKLDHIGKLLIDRETGKYLFFSRCKEYPNCNYYFLRINNRQRYAIPAKEIEKVIYTDVINIIRCIKFDQTRFYNLFKEKLFGGGKYNVQAEVEKLKLLNEEYARLIEAYFDGKVSEYDYNKRSQKLQCDIKETELKLEDSNDYETKLSIFQIRFQKFLSKIENIPVDKFEIIRMAVSKVYINKVAPNKKFDISIVYKFEDIF